MGNKGRNRLEGEENMVVIRSAYVEVNVVVFSECIKPTINSHKTIHSNSDVIFLWLVVAPSVHITNKV